jgi:hypothetical protein
MTDGKLSADVVPELVRTGEAIPLLAGTAVGPIWCADRWWYVPTDAPDDADYLPAGPELSADFDRLRRRARAIEAVQAELDGQP